jgi:hypothetical protein
MTFDEARRKHLSRLNDVVIRLHDLAADPEFLNPHSGEAAAIREDLGDVMADIVQLNAVQKKADSCPTLLSFPR